MKSLTTSSAGILFILALQSILVSCGGSSGSAAPPASISTPGTGQSTIDPNNPNVNPADTASDWTSGRYDVSGSGDNALETAITEANVKTLAPSWIFEGVNGTLSSVAVSGGTVYRTEIGTNVYAIDETTGQQIWDYLPPAVDGFWASPMIANGNLYAPAISGIFYVLSAKTGALNFSYPQPVQWGPPTSAGLPRAHYRAGAVYDNGTVYVNASNRVEPGQCMQGGQILALAPLAPQINEVGNLTSGGLSGSGIWTMPVFDAAGDMFVASGNTCNYTDFPYGDSMIRLNPNSLAVVWSTAGPPDADDLDFSATPVVANNEVVGGAKDGYVYAYDISSGQLLWKQSAFPGGVIFGALATDGRYIVVPYSWSTDNTHGAVVVYDLHGNLVWSFMTGTDPTERGHAILSAPVIAGGMVFVGYTQPNCSQNCDCLGAFDLVTGKPLWWYSTPTPIFGGIVAVQGGVFAGEFGRAMLYCFRPGGSGGELGAARRTFGSHRGNGAYFHDPWMTHTQYEGDNVGEYR